MKVRVDLKATVRCILERHPGSDVEVASRFEVLPPAEVEVPDSWFEACKLLENLHIEVSIHGFEVIGGGRGEGA
jgi:hypothetical protein